MSVELDKLVYTADDLAEMLGVTRNCIYAMIRAKRINNVFYIGRGTREVRIPRHAVETLLRGEGGNC